MAQILNPSGVPTLFYGTKSEIRRHTRNPSVDTQVGSGYTGNPNQFREITGQPNTIVSQWSMVDFGSWILATNGKDLPQIYKGTSFSAMNVESQFTTAEIFVKRGPYILAFNTSINSKGFLWNNADIPDGTGSWTPTASNQAGDLIFREASTEVVAAVRLGEFIIAYTEEETFRVSLLGAPLFFGYKPAVQGIGALSKKSIIPVGRQHYGWGRQGIYVTDGVDSQFIDNPMIRQYLKDNFQKAQGSKVNGYHDEENTAVIWSFPSDMSNVNSAICDKGISYNYLTGNWSLIGHGNTASMERQVFSQAFTGTDAGTVHRENDGLTDAGASMTSWIRTKPLDLDDPNHIKEIQAVRVGYIGSGLQYRLGRSNSEDDSITWGRYNRVPDGFKFSDARDAGRYLHLELYSSGVGDDWNVSSIDIHGVILGER